MIKKGKKVKTNVFILVALFVCSFYYCMDLVTGTECNEKDIQIKKVDLTLPEPEKQKNKEYKTTIVLDAGHGGMDSGSISESGVYEKDIALDITLKVGEELSKNGINVIYTRTADEQDWNGEVTDLQNRIDIAVENESDYFISIHLNSSEYNDGAKGFEIYTDNRNEEISDLALSIESGLSNLNYTENRGIKLTKEFGYLYVIDRNPISSLLIELGFITDVNDFTYLNSEDGQIKIAQAISKNLLESVAND